MAKTAVMVRLSETEVSALDAMALKSGISRATCATSILRQRLGPAIPREHRVTTPNGTYLGPNVVEEMADAIGRGAPPLPAPVKTVPARGQTVSPKRHAISCTCLQCKPT